MPDSTRASNMGHDQANKSDEPGGGNSRCSKERRKKKDSASRLLGVYTE
jgi:hypothetical protein